MENIPQSTDHFVVRFAYGRRGATLQSGSKTPAPVDYHMVLKAFDQLVAATLADAKGVFSGFARAGASGVASR